MEIRGDMAFHLRVAFAERDQHAQGNEFACRNVDADAGERVAQQVTQAFGSRWRMIGSSQQAAQFGEQQTIGGDCVAI